MALLHVVHTSNIPDGYRRGIAYGSSHTLRGVSEVDVC